MNTPPTARPPAAWRSRLARLWLVVVGLSCSIQAQTPVDLAGWSVVDYDRFEQGPGQWVLSDADTTVTQTRNADPTIFLGDFPVESQRVKGSLRVDDTNDDDFVGFVFAFQDNQHFYLFDWKQTRQANPLRGIAEEGMSVKVVNASSAITRDDFWPTFSDNTNRIRTLYHNNIPWQSYTNYQFELDFFPGFFSITIRRDAEVLDLIQLSDLTYLGGKFGFYNSSQANLTYSLITKEELPPRPALSVSDATVTEGNTGMEELQFEVTLSETAAWEISTRVSTAEGSALENQDYVGLHNALLSFLPGETSKTVSIPTFTDLIHEPVETFTLHLHELENAIAGQIMGLGTIIDDDEPTNQPPVITITQPSSGSVFALGETIIIEATGIDPDGEIVQVDFFADSRLLGSATEEPFTFLWEPDAAGSRNLTARATDNLNTSTTSSPATVQVNAPVNFDVAIVRNFADPEVDLMQEYLTEMELTSVVFDQEGLTFDDLRNVPLVIWNDLGQSRDGLTDADVEIFDLLSQNNVALYFIGERLASSSANLNELTRARWRALIHLTERTVTSGTGFITATSTTHPIADGPFGTMVGFPYPATMDPAVQTGSGEELLGSSGETHVLLAYDGLGRRSLTQNVLLSKTAPECGLIERERLFKNAVWWLRAEFPPPRFLNLFVEMEQSSDTVAAGTPVTFTITASHSGELEATDAILVNLLPPGMVFIDATTTQGSCGNSCGVITCHLGQLAQSTQATVTITAMPVQTGTMDNVVTLSANEPEPRTVDNIALTSLEAIDAGPVDLDLQIELFSGNEVRIQLTAPPGLRYQIETSGDMEYWELVEDFIASQEVTCFTNSVSSLTSRRFYRAVLP